VGQAEPTLLERIAAIRSRLRERTLPTLTSALIVQISIGSARPGYDLRALSSAFGLIVLLALALIGATADAVVAFALAAARDLARTRVRFGPAAPIAIAAPPPITEDLLLDKNGRLLRGAARARRIEAIERERAMHAPVLAPVAARVIELPALPPRLVASYARAIAQARASYARAALLILAAYRASARAARRVGALVPSIPVPTLPLRWIRIVAVTTTMTFVFATAIGTTGIIAQQGTVALGASTTVSILSGEVSARTADAADFRPVSDGTLLRAGMTIRTGESSYAVLTYFEGSTVSLEPNTTLVIEALEANPDGSTIISMQQQVGRTWHSVTKLLNAGSKYEVKTPTLTATVRGTAFEIGVDQNATTGEIVSSVVTTEGAVGASKPPTVAEPAPPEVIVPAGFQASAKAAEPVAPPEPAPEPERKVTVTIGTSNAVVVDPLGRANGEKDGKLVLQTPGAKVTKVDGKLVVTLPKLPDGKISTVISSTSQPGQPQAAPVSVTTVVAEKGKGESRSEETVQPPASANAPATVTGVEVKGSGSAQPAEVRVLTPSEKQDSPAPKVPEPPKAPEAPKPELLPTPEREKTDESGKSEGRDGAKVSSVVDVFVKATLPPLSIEEAAKRTEETRKAEERAKEDTAKREEERRKDNERRAEEARRAEERAKEEATRLSEERRRAEQRAREEVSKRDTARAEQVAPSNLVQNILRTITNDDDARRESEKKAEEARRAEERAREEALKASEERRRAEDAKRQDDIKRAEEQRKAAEQRAEELRKAQERAKQDAPKDIERVREIESKAREQAQRLEIEKRREAEKLLEEFRKAEEKTREEAAKRLEEQRKSEERAKEEAERKLSELRQAQERAKEEAAKAAEERRREDEQRKRDDEQRKGEDRPRQEQRSSGFVPVQTLDPLPGRLGSNERGKDRGR